MALLLEQGGASMLCSNLDILPGDQCLKRRHSGQGIECFGRQLLFHEAEDKIEHFACQRMI
jgi:hypothetical protein